MKNLLTLLCCLCFTSTALIAQLDFGVKAGINYTGIQEMNTISELGFLDSQYKSSLHFGFLGTISLTERMGLQPEVLYSIKGFKQDASTIGIITIPETFFNYHYVSVPLLFKYKLKIISIEVGPEFSFLARFFSKTANSSSPAIEVDNRFDTGIVGGISAKLGKFFVSGRYIQGVMNLYRGVTYTDQNGVVVDPQPSAKNSVIQISGGYYF